MRGLVEGYRDQLLGVLRHRAWSANKSVGRVTRRSGLTRLILEDTGCGQRSSVCCTTAFVEASRRLWLFQKSRFVWAGAQSPKDSVESPDRRAALGSDAVRPPALRAERALPCIDVM